jgi:phage FluMu protein Com
MCRYAFRSYKSHFACFNCQKTFKRRHLSDITDNDKQEYVEAKCPQCATLMADMGLDFESPKKTENKKWEHLKLLYKNGLAFHSCGCQGPGYIPRDKEQLVTYYKNILNGYEEELRFWRKRKEPNSQSEMDKEKNKNFDRFIKLPYLQDKKNGLITNEKAINFWIGRVQAIQKQINSF